eukprot:scaffold154011_cov31-Tisochrysis_lutea.AAC.2
MLIGVLAYAVLVLASLLLATIGTGANVSSFVLTACRSAVIAGGAVVGAGAAVLWTAQGVRPSSIRPTTITRSAPAPLNVRPSTYIQLFACSPYLALPLSMWLPSGRLMLEWSNGTDQGELFAIFWGLFNLAAVVGGLATFAYFSRSDVEPEPNAHDHGQWQYPANYIAPFSTPKASAPLYVLFLCLILLGAAATRRLSDGPAARLGSDGRLSMARPPAPAPSPVEVAGGVRAVHQAPSVRLQLACATVSNGAATFDPGVRQADAAGAEPLLGQQQPAWSAACQEARETLSVFGSRRMAILAPFFFYTGFNQPYQLNTCARLHACPIARDSHRSRPPFPASRSFYRCLLYPLPQSAALATAYSRRPPSDSKSYSFTPLKSEVPSVPDGSSIDPSRPRRLVVPPRCSYYSLPF